MKLGKRKVREMRKLSKQFMDDLLGGLLSRLLTIVKSDDTLSLEIRDDYINLYYRGGNLYKIEPKSNGYSFDFDTKYCNNSIQTKQNISFSNLATIDDYIEMIPFIKREMDFWFHDHPKTEREYQQTILRENNKSSISGDTDYFIADIEYANKENGSRFDLVGVKWLSTSVKRKDRSSPTLALMEFKYGDNALTGTAGIIKHFQDIESFIKTNKLGSLYSEIEDLFNQKMELGLIKGASGSIHFDTSKNPEFLILCANHKPNKTAFKRELKGALSQCPNIQDCVDVKIATSSHIGYGLYDAQMIDLLDYIK